LHSILIESGIP